MRAIYSCLLILIRPFVRLRLYWRARTAPAYGERVEERFGHVPPQLPRGALWLHTVSAGETIAAAPLIKRLMVELEPQKIPLLVTTMTPTGSAEVVRLFGDSVAHCYAPYDFADAVERFLDAAQPRALVLMETEIWPNMITMTAKRNLPVALVNARLSERSARGYARVKTLVTPVLRHLSWIACQFPADAQRFRELGASGAQVEVVGNVKFDVAEVPVSNEQTLKLQRIESVASLADRQVWIAGSTHDGEDGILLEAHQRLRERLSDACLFIVPRHPERFEEVFKLAAAAFPASTSLRDESLVLRLTDLFDAPDQLEPSKPAVVLVDVMGLLRPLYTISHVGFLGGSLVDLGGHNPIEAAVAGIPMLMGPGRFNFVAVCDAFADAGCLHLVNSPEDLERELFILLTDESSRLEQGQRAAALVSEHAGATERLCVQLARIAAGAPAQ